VPFGHQHLGLRANASAPKALSDQPTKEVPSAPCALESQRHSAACFTQPYTDTANYFWTALRLGIAFDEGFITAEDYKEVRARLDA
jgi:hypothetical protein